VNGFETFLNEVKIQADTSKCTKSKYECLLHVFSDIAEDYNIVRGDKKAHKIQFADKILTGD
jgi:hypothetical protein